MRSKSDVKKAWKVPPVSRGVEVSTKKRENFVIFSKRRSFWQSVEVVSASHDWSRASHVPWRRRHVLNSGKFDGDMK